MTNTANNPRAAFFRMFVPLLLGIGIGISIGVNMDGSAPDPDGIDVASGPSADAGVENKGPDPDEPVAVAPVPEADEPGIATPDGLADSETMEDDASESDLVEPAVPMEPASVPAPGEVWPARHLVLAVPGTELDEGTTALLAEVLPGAVMLREENIESAEQVARLVDAIKRATGIGAEPTSLPLIVVDPDRTPLPSFGIEGVPAVSDLGAALNTTLAHDTGGNVADALRDLGVTVVLDPPMDVQDEEGKATFAGRMFGSDNALVTALGLSVADGLMQRGVIPVIKHYPGHGATVQDVPNGMAVLDKDIPGLAKIMFPFSEAVGRGIPGILVGHIAVPAIDRGDVPTPASMSERMLSQILRVQWKYEGVLLAEDMSDEAALGDRTQEEAVLASLNAGADAVLLLDPRPERVRAVCGAIALAVENGELDGATLQRSRERLEAWEVWLANPQGLAGPLPDVPERLKIAAKALPPVAVPTPPSRPEVETIAVPDGEFIEHTIERGETLSAIGKRYGVTSQQIMAWNNLSDGNIKFGFKLKIYGAEAEPPAEAAPEVADEPVPEPKAVEAEAVEQPEEPEAEAPAEPEMEAAPEPESTPEPEAEPVDAPAESEQSEAVETAPGPETQPEGTKEIVHVVVPGDMLSRIAVRYGVQQSDVMAWNNMNDTVVKLDQKLVIYVPEAYQPEPEIVEPAPAAAVETAPVAEPAEEEPDVAPAPEAPEESPEEVAAPEGE